MTTSNSVSEDNVEETSIAYFGYGSMSNPVSRARRNVKTFNERPAVLKGYSINFELRGFANIAVSDADSSVHGVLMNFSTEEDWKKIVDIEVGYSVKTLDVIPYGECETPVRAHVFIAEDFSEPDTPTQRYLRVISDGLKHHGIENEYIESKINSVKMIPSRKREEFRQFPNENDLPLPVISEDDYKKLDDPHFIIGKRVIRCIHIEPRYEPGKDWFTKFAIGKESLTYMFVSALYNPDLPEAENKNSCTDEHHAWVEDEIYNMFCKNGWKGTAVYQI